MNNYEMIYKIKQLLYDAIHIKEIQELDLFISEFKAFISNEETLEEEYKKRIQNYQDKYNNNKKNYMTFAKIVDKILNYNDYKMGINNTKNDKNFDLAIGSVAYFPIMHKIMGDNDENIKAYSSVSEFYYQNIINYFLESKYYCVQEKKHIITRINKILSIYCKNGKIIPLIDFAALTLEDQCVYGRSYIVKPPFYFLWLKSAIIGVLYELQSFLKNPLKNECTEKEIIQMGKTNPPKGNLNQVEYCFLRLRKNLEDNKYAEIVKHPDLCQYGKYSVQTLKQMASKINNRLGTNSIDQAITVYEKQYGLIT